MSEASGATAHHRHDTIDEPLVAGLRNDDRARGPASRSELGGALEGDLDAAIFSNDRVIEGLDLVERHVGEVDPQPANEAGQERVAFLDRAGAQPEPLGLQRVEPPTLACREYDLSTGRTEQLPDNEVLTPHDRVQEPGHRPTGALGHGRSQPISSRMSRTRIRWGPNRSS